MRHVQKLLILQHWLYQRLRWSERYLRTDMVYLASGSFWLTTGQAVSALCSFGLAVAFANLLPAETYGNYKYILSLAGILGIFSLSGLSTALAQAVARGEQGLLLSTARLYALWCLGITLAALAGAGYYWVHDNHILAISLGVIGVFSPLLNAFTLYNTFLYSKKVYAQLTVYTSLVSICSAVGMTAALWFTSYVPFLVGAYFALNTILNGYFFWRTRRHFPEPTRPASAIVPYGLHLSAMNVLSVTAQQIDKVLLFTTTGGAQLAVYAFALAIPEQARALLKNVARLAFPKFTERSLAEIKRSLPFKLALFGGVILGASGLYALIAPWIFDIFFPQYMDSVWYSQLIALTLFTAVGAIPLSALQAHAAKRELYLYTISTNVVQIVLTATLIIGHGLWGAVAANILNRVFAFVAPLVLLYTSKS